jgi:hypothetical protein
MSSIGSCGKRKQTKRERKRGNHNHWTTVPLAHAAVGSFTKHPQIAKIKHLKREHGRWAFLF